MSEDAAIVLAAGKGTRMRSSLPKVLHSLAGKPMLERVLDALQTAGFSRPTVVVGYGADRIRGAIGDRCFFVDQSEQLGTGDAARVALSTLPSTCRRILLVHGDDPLTPPDTYRDMLALHNETGAPIVLLTSHVQDTRSLGRVIREGDHPVALVQESELGPNRQHLDEVNLGAYVFDVDFLRKHFDDLQPHPPKNEFYLTDMVQIAAQAHAANAGKPVAAITIPGGNDVLGINDLVQLEAATAVLYRATNQRLMERGVTLIHSASTFIDDDVLIAPGTVIHPFTIISGSTQIGAECVIGPGTHVISSRIGNRCTVISSTVEHAIVEDDVRIGPYSHLRRGAVVSAGAEIGNYAEIKQSHIGPGSKMHHFSYVGDAEVGTNVNIGAGVVTCNYDGKQKHRTSIGDGAFIGSDTMLRAPVRVGENARTGAGSVVTHDVPAGDTVAGVPARPLRDDASAEGRFENNVQQGDRQPDFSDTETTRRGS